MKKKFKIIIISASIIIFSNLPIVRSIFSLFLDEDLYRYSNANGSMTFVQIKSRDLDMLRHWHEGCLKTVGKDKNIYRLFAKNPFAFWRWWSYFYDERYHFPYKNWEEIKKIRDTMKVKTCSTEF